MTQKQPVVAFEDSLLFHGLPYPENLDAIEHLEECIRKKGAIPVSFVFYQGKIQIGITSSLRKQFAKEKDIHSVSRQNMAVILSRKLPAIPTVSLSIYCAYLANFPILITGSIGDFNFYADTVDDSASPELIELASTPISVVCSGVKSILDLPKTLALLETQGIPALGFNTEEFPAFYNHSSKIPLAYSSKTALEVAQLMDCHYQLNPNKGMIIANPIPKTLEISDEDINPIFDQAREEWLAQSSQTQSSTMSSSLLKRVAELTLDQNIHAYIELLKQNAALGAEIAAAFCSIRSS